MKRLGFSTSCLTCCGSVFGDSVSVVPRLKDTHMMYCTPMSILKGMRWAHKRVLGVLHVAIAVHICYIFLWCVVALDPPPRRTPNRILPLSLLKRISCGM